MRAQYDAASTNGLAQEIHNTELIRQSICHLWTKQWNAPTMRKGSSCYDYLPIQGQSPENYFCT